MALRPARIGVLALFFISMVAIGALPDQANQLSARFGDKLLHVAAYAIMTALCFAAIVAPRLHRVVATIVTMALLGLADESIQSLLPYRNASLTDWCFDVLTATLVSLLLTRSWPSLDPDPHA